MSGASPAMAGTCGSGNDQEKSPELRPTCHLLDEESVVAVAEPVDLVGLRAQASGLSSGRLRPER